MSHYKPYPAYKDSGVDWLGRVPEGWGVCRIRYILSEKRPVKGRSIPAGAISFGEVVEKVMLNEETLETYQEVLPGEFLINPINLNYDLKSLRVALCKIEVRVSPAYIVLCPIKEMNQRFLRWLLYLFDVAHMKTLGAGVRQTITFEDVGNCQVVIPTESEQAVVAEILDRETARIDALIEKKARFIELLREKRQALISHAVTKGLAPNVRMKDSGVEWLGEVPEHWKMLPLKRLISSIGQGWSPECEARIPEQGEWGVVKVGCVNGGVFRPEESKALPTEMEPRPELSLKAGDVLISRANTRELVGSCAVVPHDYPYLLLCDKLYRVGCGERVTPDFLAALVTVYGRRAVEIEATGASSSMVNIAQSVILDLLVAVPGANEQVEIISRVSAATTRIEHLREKTERSIELLKERRYALITAAVTGQIDLRGDV